MGIKLKRPPFLKIEKAYRLATAVSFYVVFAIIISAVVVVPLFGSRDAKWVLLLYSFSFWGYLLALVGCAVLGSFATVKTQSEIIGLQTVLHIVDFLLVGSNYKLFTALTLYGLGLDAKAEKFIGGNTDEFVKECTSQWFCLIAGILIACVMAVLSTVKLTKEKNAD